MTPSRAPNPYHCPLWDDEDRPVSWAKGVEVILKGACERCLGSAPSVDDICGWHQQVFAELVPLNYYAGNVRQDDWKRPCLGQNVQVDGVLGTHFEQVPQEFRKLLDQLEVKLRSLDLQWPNLDATARAKGLATVVGVAVTHFIKMHPFLNGNGRTSRFLWAVLLARFGCPPQFAVARRPGSPYPQVMAAAMRGNAAPAIAIVLRGLAVTPKLAVPKTTA